MAELNLIHLGLLVVLVIVQWWVLYPQRSPLWFALTAYRRSTRWLQIASFKKNSRI